MKTTKLGRDLELVDRRLRQKYLTSVGAGNTAFAKVNNKKIEQLERVCFTKGNVLH